jgi:LPXTG-site transpeptidase (sortase) family protein
LRDLFVFLFLFLLGLAVWTTGLFPAAPAQAVPAVEPEVEQKLPAVESSPALQVPDSGEPTVSQAKSASSRTAIRTGIEADRVKSPVRRSTERKERSDARDPVPNEPVIQRIVIPSLKVDGQVVDIPFNGVTWDISTLGQDIARLGEVPGENAGKNIVLAGHFSVSRIEIGPFRYISRLDVGEPILVYTDRIVYIYQVREHAVVGDQDARVIAYTSEPQLTLLTCETWDEETGKFLRRRVVFADLVRSEPLGHPTIQ